MAWVIILFGALTSIAGLVIVINPGKLFDWLKTRLEKIWLQILAVGIRLGLGGLLVYLSDDSRYPLAVEIIGWLSIASAIFFLVIGRGYFMRIMTWALAVPDPYCRVGGLFAIGFGAFLVYAFI